MTRVHQVVIIGSGFAGLGMAIALKRAGEHDFVVLEKAADVGGTWRDNTYPGCSCDVPSMLYSYSFEPNPRWTRAYPAQQEIWDYQRHCAEKYVLRPHLRFGTEVVQASFDDDDRLWRVRCRDGTIVCARIVVSAVGALHVPSVPELPGLDTFAGHTFHSAQWDHDCHLDGKRVAVIGTGSSAVQFVPHVADVAAQLRVFQRSAPWVLPKMDRPLTRVEHAAYRRVPALQRLRRAIYYWWLEAGVLGLLHPRLMPAGEALVRYNIRRAIKDDDDLVARVTPDYKMGCKRIVNSSDYYPALTRPHVDLVTSRITQVRPGGLVTADGAEHPADVIIFGTGFHIAKAWAGLPFVGAGGVSLQRAWSDGVSAHYGMTVAGFPNLFLIFGPNTGLGHNSVVFMIEAQVRYIMGCLRLLGDRQNAVLDVRAQVQQASERRIQARFTGTVFDSGCSSHYLDESGRNRTIWPGSTVSYWWHTRRPRVADYEIRG